MATVLYPTTEIELPNPKPKDWLASLPTYRAASLIRGKSAATITDNTIASLANVVANAGSSWAELGGAQSTVVAFQGVEGITANTPIWITNPLRAVTIAGNITVNVRAFESAAQANYGAYCFVYKVDGKDGTVTKIGYGGNTTELGTVEANVAITIVPTSTALNDGDMIAIMFGYGSAGGTSTSGRTASFVYSGLSGATGDTSLSFTETLVEMPVPPTAPIPLLIRLARFRRGIRRLDNNILNPDDSVRVSYVDNSTVSSTTSVTSVETVDYVDSATITSVTTVSQIKIPSQLNNDDIVDNFNRVETNPLSTPWVKRQVSSESNGFSADGALAQQSLTGGFIPNVSAYEGPVLADAVTSVTLQNPGTNQYVFARLQGSTIFNGFNCYSCRLVFSAGDWVISVDKYSSGSPTNLGFSIIPGALSPGDKIAIRCVGTTIEGWYCASGVWTLAVSVVDATYDSGYSGLYANDATTLASFDDFSLNYSSEVYTPSTAAPPVAPSIRPLLMRLEKIGGKARLLHSDLPDVPILTFTYTDSATISSVTSVQSSESTDFLDTSGIVQGTSSVTSVEIAQDVDAFTVAGTTTPSSAEVAAYVDSATVGNTTSLTSTESADYVDTATVGVLTSISSADTADYVDAATITSITFITSVDVYTTSTWAPRPLLILLGRRIGLLHNNILNPADSVRVDYTDSATISSTTSVSAIETADYVDGTTPACTTNVTSSETAQDTETNTVAGITTPSSVDVAAYVDSNTIGTVTSLSYTEIAQYIDSAAIASATSVTTLDTADYVDSSTVTSITTVTSIDAATSTTIQPHPLLIRLTMRRGKMKFLDNTMLAPTSPPSFDYVDSATISSVTTISSVEATDYIESAVISNKTSINTTDVTADVDSSTVPSITAVTSSDVAAYVDGVVVPSKTTLSSVEIAQLLDSATIPTNTILTYTEFAAYIDSNVVLSTTSLGYVETADYLDSATVAVKTALTYTEDYQAVPTYVDTATIPTITTLIAFEYGPGIAFDLYGIAVRRWNSNALVGRLKTESTRRWNSNAVIGRLHVEAISRRWVAKWRI